MFFAKKKPDPSLVKRILLVDPRNQSIKQIDDTDLTSLIDIHLGEIGVGRLQLDHENAMWFSDKAVSQRYGWFFEGMATGEYEERRYCMGILVGFGEKTAWDEATLLDWMRWHDKKNVWGD